jgi:hypothetical protein
MPSAWGKCFRSFPQKECKSTNTDVDGYPEYRRRMTGPNVHIIPELGKYKDIDNSWVVPYNPYLLLKYNTHINLEVRTSHQQTALRVSDEYQEYQSDTPLILA